MTPRLRQDFAKAFAQVLRHEHQRPVVVYENPPARKQPKRKRGT